MYEKMAQLQWQCSAASASARHWQELKRQRQPVVAQGPEPETGVQPHRALMSRTGTDISTSRAPAVLVPEEEASEEPEVVLAEPEALPAHTLHCLRAFTAFMNSASPIPS